jgi:hypothetical protein
MPHEINPPQAFLRLRGVFCCAKESIVPTRSRVMCFVTSKMEKLQICSLASLVVLSHMMHCDPALPNSLRLWQCLAHELLCIFMARTNLLHTIRTENPQMYILNDCFNAV